MDVQDRLDVMNTLGRLDHIIDQGELGRLDTVLTVDAVNDMSEAKLPTMHGIEAIRAGALRSVTYRDGFRRTSDGWRIARRTITPQVAPLGGLLLPSAAPAHHEAAS